MQVSLGRQATHKELHVQLLRWPTQNELKDMFGGSLSCVTKMLWQDIFLFLFFATMGPLYTHTYTQKHTHCDFWFCVLMGFLYVWTNMCLCLCIYLCFSFFFFDSSVLSYSELLFSSILFYYFYSLDYCFLRRDRMVVDPVWGEVEQELGRVGGRKTAIWIYCKKKNLFSIKKKIPLLHLKCMY